MMYIFHNINNLKIFFENNGIFKNLIIVFRIVWKYIYNYIFYLVLYEICHSISSIEIIKIKLCVFQTTNSRDSQSSILCKSHIK